jgi:hypothetical protein
MWDMKKFDLIKVDPGSVESSYVRSHCLVVSIYDHTTMRLDSIEEDGFKCYGWGSSIGLVAPCEAQPEWQSINCAKFIAYRMEAIKQIGEMGKPRIVPEWADEETQVEMHWPWDHECKPVEEEIGYKPSMRKMRSWMKVRKSDEVLWNYYLTRGEGIEPKMWHDDYERFYDGSELDWYSDLPGYDTGRGVYMHDGMYATASDSQLVWENIRHDETYAVE